MTEIAGLLAGVLLPWAAGFALVRMALTRIGESDPWVEAGYGHFAGVLLVTLLLRAQDLAGMRLAFVPIAVVLALVAVAGLVLSRQSAPRTTSMPARELTADPLGIRWLATIALVLLALRVGTLAVEVLLRPLFAWDAWSQWGTKAKVWSALSDIVPFIGYDDWLARKPGYTDTAPHYPATIPLLQTWMALAIGRFDDALVNAPWIAGFVALGLGVFGQLRRLGVGTAWATIAAWLVLSLPLLDTHVALPGYADFHLAAVYALAALALAQWETSPSRGALVLFVVAAALLPLLKVPGIAWLGTLALGLAIARFGTTPARIAGIGVAVLAVTVAGGMYVGSAKVAADAAATQYRIVESLTRHLFAFGNFHLLWYLLPLVLAAGWREVVALKATTIALLAGFGFLLWTFLFTQAGDWVVDYTTVNRALLHIAPALTAYAALLAWRWARSRAAAADPMPSAAPADPPRAAASA
jgi:hypothetical protein